MKAIETHQPVIEEGTTLRERREVIARMVEQRGRVSVAELSRSLGVSEVTIRKDLAALELDHHLIRTRGGAIRRRISRAELAFEVRYNLHRPEKELIGRAAAAMVGDGETVALDSSTTALQVARNLKDRQELTVITNSIRIAAELAGLQGLTVLVPGGRLRSEAFSLVGGWSRSWLRGIHVKRAFVGAVGFTLEHGLTEATEEEAEVKRGLVAAAGEVVAVIDHSKWGKVAFTTFCRPERIGTVISDPRAPAAQVAAAREHGIVVRLVSEPGSDPSRSGGAAR
ncbi:MAG TPA: DeoR/GlpR family DNA-binding transcription regulator [Candidatus Dormibacteraeota bacterium]|nr:DeoR/GlpR family DNA-binding transcription regulator [Candidatus Dormibacteraeota bacterium]